MVCDIGRWSLWNGLRRAWWAREGWPEMMPVGQGEVVTVGEFFAGKMPVSFAWRGRKHRIRWMEAGSSGSRRKRQEATTRDYFQVRTVEGLRCWLSKGKRRGDWRMEKVLAAGGR
jgi:hypothetical protein